MWQSNNAIRQKHSNSHADWKKFIIDAINGLQSESQNKIFNINEAFNGDLNMDRLTFHLQMLSDIYRHNVITSVIKLKQFLKTNDSLCDVLAEIVIMVQLFYTIPVTTCSAEKTFSCL